MQDDQRILEDDGFHAPTLNRSATQEVLLIAPPRNFKQAQVSGYSGFSKNLGLAYIAAVLRDHGLHVSILDAFALGIDQFTPVDRPNGRVFRCGLSVEFILSRIQPTARWVGINVPFSNVAEIAFDLARQIKMHHPYVKVVLGGVHPSTFPEASLQQPGVDYVIAGEGEYAMLNLVMGVDPSTIDGLWWRDAQGNVHAPANPARVAVLDQLPLPAWDLLPMERYLARSPRGDQHHKTLSLVTSRGCPFGCSFCSIHPVAGRNWRARSPQNVLMEVREAIQRYGINHLEIEDDNFTLDRDRALAILEGLKAFPGLTWAAHNGLRVDTLDEELLTAIRDSGCIQLNLAIEHGSASVLRSMNKRLSLQKVEGVVKICGKLGIHCIGFCIVGHPGETNEAFRESFLFFKRLRQHGLSSVVSFIVNAYPGTRLYQEARREGWLNPATDSQLFFIEDEFVSVTTPDFKADTVHRRKEAMEKLNAYPSIDTDALLSSLDLGVTSFGLGNKQKSFMALSVLKNKADILTARAELAKRVLDLTSEDTCREFSGKGYITPIGDTAKSWDVLKTIEFFESDVAKTAPILDIGSFCSEIPGMLHRLGYSNISGIDLNPDVVRMPYCENIHYSIGNFIQTSFPDESFAAITAISVIEHGFNSTELISEVHRLLKPGGYFIASVDYWKEKISTDGLSAFNMDWKIFSGDEIMARCFIQKIHDLVTGKDLPIHVKSGQSIRRNFLFPIIHRGYEVSTWLKEPVNLGNKFSAVKTMFDDGDGCNGSKGFIREGCLYEVAN